MIELVGAPTAIFIDAAAMGAEGSPSGDRIRRLLSALGIAVIDAEAHVRTITRISVGIFGSRYSEIPGCYGWYVGPGPAPTWMHASTGSGPSATADILGLLGTGFAQERAGAAFRAAGSKTEIPAGIEYQLMEILGGISRAVASRNGLLAAPPVRRIDRDELLRASVSALNRCCAPNGAIAAAPRTDGPDDPDYWFFWQRDAAHVAVALHALTGSGADADIRAWGRNRADAYAVFVSALGRSQSADLAGLAASRYTMNGEPIGGYGDPQPDGPAATALALLTIVPDPHAALEAAGPFLEYLVHDGELGYDLWELIWGRSFHASNLARRALRRGARIAQTAGNRAASDRYAGAELSRGRSLEAFRRDGGGLHHVREPQPAWFGVTSQLDISAIASVVLAYDVTDPLLNVDDPDIVATVDALSQEFVRRWPVNDAWRREGHPGHGFGRFPEDCNDGIGSTGGNPWPLTTLWVAQFHLRLAQRLTHLGHSPAEEVAAGTAYLEFVVAHCQSDAMPEQLDGVTGIPRGARPLAWTHAELVTTLLALDERHPSAGTDGG
jgi:hypothetical protein